MASVPFVGTLESDDDVDQLDNESDSEEEPEKPVKRAKTKKRNRSLFEDDFQFFSGELDEHFQDPWNLDVAIKFAKQKQESNLNSSSLQDKITKRRETRRKKKSNKENEQNIAEAEEEENCENEEKHEELDSVKEDGEDSIGTANTILPCDEQESSSEEDEITDKITEKKRKFFEEPPPQVMDQNFTAMNLSRPLLKSLQADSASKLDSVWRRTTSGGEISSP